MTEIEVPYIVTDAQRKMSMDLAEPFPDEAYEQDDSRGFPLTGIQGYFIIERLTEVFGPCGLGWKFTHRKVLVETTGLVVVIVSLRYRHGGQWSEPIEMPGSQRVVKGRWGDAYKGAITDGLKKCTSMLGVGKQVYKGLRKGKKKAHAEVQATEFIPDAAKFERAGAVVFPGGKHEAECIKDVDQADRGYIAWWTEKEDPGEDDNFRTAWAACRYFRTYRKWKEAQA